MNALMIAALVAVTNGFGRVEVDTLGAHVMSYVPAGASDVLFRQPDARRPGTWYHGGIPVCWPWFGRNGPEGSDFHGLVRHRDWKVVSRTDSGLELALEDEGCRLTYGISLGDDGLALELRATNGGNERSELTAGFHPYFSVSHPTNVVVRTPSGDRIAVYGGMDGYLPFGEGCYEVDDAGTGRRLALRFENNSRIVIWNGGPDESQDGMRAEDWTRYVCVEPVAAPRKFVLAPGETRRLGMKIRCVRSAL